MGCSISGSFGNSEIPLPVTSFYLLGYAEASPLILVEFWNYGRLTAAYSSRGHSQVGSLAGAAHLLKDNAGVLR